MWHAGNGTFANLPMLPSISQWEASSTSLVTIFLALSIALLFILPSSSDDKIPKLNGLHLVTAWRFLTKRYDFFREHFGKTGVNIFSFHILQHHVVAVTGEANRKIFFNSRGLDFNQGYRILSGGTPSLKNINVHIGGPYDVTDFIKRLLLLLRQERVDKVLPVLFEDVNNRMKEWGTEGKINPFSEIYDLVVQMTVRMATCRELSDDREAVSRLAKHFWDLEKSATPVAVLLPWLPTSAKKKKKNATMGLYTMLLSYVHLRRKSPTPSMDTIDLFISQGLPNDIIVAYMMGIIFGGVVNTGVNSCWALLHLGTNPNWKRKVIDEYKALVDQYTNTTSSDPLHIRLSTIPLIAWENELPSMEAVIRETLRISGSTTFLRRNLEEDIQIGTTTVKTGDFVAYPAADVHLNPDIYTNPMTFDPDRYGPGREEDRKETNCYVAWGAGRHPCPGTRIAKLEIKMILAMIFLGYEYEIVDGKGNYLKAVPDQNRNDIQQSRPVGDPCYLKYKRVVE